MKFAREWRVACWDTTAEKVFWKSKVTPVVNFGEIRVGYVSELTLKLQVVSSVKMNFFFFFNILFIYLCIYYITVLLNLQFITYTKIDLYFI